ncbi:MAG: D-alanine--D-alanine ligase [Actinobacteria bacterium]|nr:D-alanine--D-alanine ligase [Actinomycetota bacterium]
MGTGSRVGVVFGGRSVEHEVSIVTAHQVMAALGDRYEVVPIYVTREGNWLTGAGLNDLVVYKDRRWDEVGEEGFIPPVTGYGGLMVPGGRLKGSRKLPLDVAIPCIHGTFGEDGTLQGLLELAGIPYAGSSAGASALGMDKVAMKAVFASAGLPVVDDVLVRTSRLDGHEDSVIAQVEQKLGYPVFVKPTRLGSSVGIGKAKDREGLLSALDVARRYDTRILVERAMEGCIEVNCSVLGGPGVAVRASLCEQPVAAEEFLTFSDKYLRGGKSGDASENKAVSKSSGMASLDRRIPAPIPEDLTKQVQKNAVGAFNAIEAAGVARIDSFVDEQSGETWVMEINTVPGSFAFYLWEADGLPFERLVDELIEIALASHRERSELMFSFDSGMLDRTGGVKSDG